MALCFMIMPYGRRATQVEPSSNAPGEIDFNALWDRAFAPTIKALGYDPVRADQDTGALIITQMIERIYFADLVLADMTIPNGNVYYEVGVRHAAKRTGCVLLAADWSKQLFDVAQMRTVRYPLTEGNIEDATAGAVVSGDQGTDRYSCRDGNSPVHRLDQGISGECGSGGGVDDEGGHGSDGGLPGEDPRGASLSKKRPHGGAKELVGQSWKRGRARRRDRPDTASERLR